MYRGTSSRLSWLLQHSNFLIVCFIAFLGFRLALIFLVPGAEPFTDARWYLDRGITLAEQGVYSENGIPTAYWPVGYPAFLALLFKIVGPSVLVAQLANLALAALTFWLLYLVAQRFLKDELAARGAVLLLAVYPNSAVYVAMALSEPLYTFLLLGASLALLSPRNWLNTLIAGGVFGLAILVKPQTLLLVPALAFVVFLGEWSIRQVPSAMLRAAAVVCIALVVVSPWTLRNYSVFGTFVLVSSNGGMALLAGNNPSVVGDYRRDYSETDPLYEQARFSLQDQIDANERARALAHDWIKSHPQQFLGLIPKKIFRQWAPDGEGEWGFQGTPFYNEHRKWFRSIRVLNQAFYSVAIILFFVALWKLVKSRSAPGVYYGAMVVFVFTLIGAVFSGQSRYHFPAMPFILAYAAWVLVGSGASQHSAPPIKPVT